MSAEIIQLRPRTRPSSIPPVILGSIRNATPRDAWGGALLLAGALFVAGIAFGWALFHVDAPACIQSDRQPGRGM